jgi:hypothetical protein
LLIEHYFEHIRNRIEQSPVIQTFTITYEKRTSYRGYIRGNVLFVDDTVLHIREFVEVRDTSERLTYAYHYMRSDQRLVFRYDNTEHHQKLNLSTYPHHKHDGSEDVVVESSAPHLETVLYEIETLIEVPT